MRLVTCAAFSLTNTRVINDKARWRPNANNELTWYQKCYIYSIPGFFKDNQVGAFYATYIIHKHNTQHTNTHTQTDTGTHTDADMGTDTYTGTDKYFIFLF